MKLRYKIFISILLVSLTTFFISSYLLINRSHLESVTREQERSLNEFTFLKSSLDNGIDFSSSIENIKLLLSRYADYYASRDIHLLVFRNEELLTSEFISVRKSAFQKLLEVKTGTNLVQVIKENDKYYFFVTGRPSEASTFVLVYARDISSIYKERTQNISLATLIVLILILLLGILSYVFSRWITKPIDTLNHSANAISGGNYSIRIPDTKDEFHSLAQAFNQMASDVEARTTELEEKAKELQVFIDDLSHEMNTPLTSIQGYSEFLMNANASEDQKQKAADTIRTEAKRMKDIYTKLMTLTFAREHELELAPVKIDSLFSDLRETFAPQLQQHNIRFIITNRIDRLLIDRTYIHMLFSNLIKNSIQAVSDNGMIELKSYYEGKNAVLEVSDNGIGIPFDKLTDVTKPFFRVDKSRSRKTGGAGLGLSICKNITDLHHADLIIDSTEGKGTSIRVIFYNSVTTTIFHG